MCSFFIIVAPNNLVGDLSLGLSTLLDSRIVKLDNIEIFNVELWPFPIYFTSNVKGKLINASLCLRLLGDMSSLISIIISLVFRIFTPKPVKGTEKHQKHYLHTILCSFLLL